MSRYLSFFPASHSDESPSRRLTVVEPEAYARLAVAESDDFASFRILLGILRAAGCDFADAWRVCLPPPKADRQRVALREALVATRDAWARAWDREPPTPAEARLVALAPFLLDEEAEPVEARAVMVA